MRKGPAGAPPPFVSRWSAVAAGQRYGPTCGGEHGRLVTIGLRLLPAAEGGARDLGLLDQALLQVCRQVWIGRRSCLLDARRCLDGGLFGAAGRGADGDSGRRREREESACGPTVLEGGDVHELLHGCGAGSALMGWFRDEMRRVEQQNPGPLEAACVLLVQDFPTRTQAASKGP